MARVLEALRQSQAGLRRLDVAASAEKPREGNPSPAEADPEPDPVEEMPFIEIGPAGTVPQASASVLATGPLPIRQSPRPRSPVVVPLPGPELPSPRSELEPVQVAFRSLEKENSELDTDLVTFHQPDHPVSQQYQALFTALRSTWKGQPPLVLLFSAARPAVGMTTAVLNLAITAARQGTSRVAVVDANLARPSVARRLALAEAPGLRDLLAGTVALDEVIRETDQERLWAITAGDSSTDDAPLAIEELASVVAALRPRFDLVLVDAPVWSDTKDTGALASASDAVYLVLPQSEATQSGVKGLLRAIRRRTRRLSGLILTQH